MKAKLFLATLMTSGVLFAQTAMAHDEVIGALFGGLAGAAIGSSFDGHGAPVVGAVIGAAIGSAIANEHDYRAPRNRYVTYGPPVVYAPRPVIVERHEYRWRHDHRPWGPRDGDRRWDRDNDRHHDRNDYGRDRW